MAKIWVVFNSDGHECSDFVGAFETKESAEKAAGEVREAEEQWYRDYMQGEKWSGSVDTVEVELGKYKIP